MAVKRWWKYWWPTVAWAGVIFWFSSRPTIATVEIYWQDFALKKIAHFSVYAVLAILVYRALKHTVSKNRPVLLVLTGCITTLYAISDEFHQSFTPGREPHIRDVVIDMLGIFTALKVVDSGRIIKV